MNQDSAAFLNAIRGPVIMITVGVLFALDNFTPLSFHRTWPVLLVVVGILSLGKSARTQQGKFQYRAQWGPPRPPVTPPTPPSPAAAPSGPATAPPGTYRGSTYEATPGGSTPRGSENRERPSSPQAAPSGNPPGDRGGTL